MNQEQQLKQQKSTKINIKAQSQKVFEIMYTTPEGKEEFVSGYSKESPKEFLSVPFGGKDLMTTPDQPIMDSPQGTGDNRRKIEYNKERTVGQGALSENSPTRQYSRSQESLNDLIMTTPGSAEEQLQIFQKATKMRNMHSGKKTQVHAKVNYIFYWVDLQQADLSLDEQESKRVEIMGEFSNWKPIKMKLIKDLENNSEQEEPPQTSEGLASTHFLIKDIDPKHEHFIFRIDGGEELQTCELYDLVSFQGTKVNKVNLANMMTHLVIEKKDQSQKKSKESVSQYTTFSGFLENEQKQINDERAMEEVAPMSLDSEAGSPNKFGSQFVQTGTLKQSDFNKSEQINEKLLQVKIITDSPKARAIICQQKVSEMMGEHLKQGRTLQDLSDIRQEDLYKDSFKYELDDVVQNSPLKESMQSCRSKKGSITFDKMFYNSRDSLKMAGKNRSSTLLLLNSQSDQADQAKPASKRRVSHWARVSNQDRDRINENPTHKIEEGTDQDDLSSEEQMDIETTAVQLFNNLFMEVFEENQQQKNDQGYIYITQDQYNSCVNQLGQRLRDSILELDDNQEQIDHLKTLFSMADKENQGKITKEQLINAIQEDLKIQMMSPTTIKREDPNSNSNYSDQQENSQQVGPGQTIPKIPTDHILRQNIDDYSPDDRRNSKRKIKSRGKMKSYDISKLQGSGRSHSEVQRKSDVRIVESEDSSNFNGSQIDSDGQIQHQKGHNNQKPSDFNFYNVKKNGQKQKIRNVDHFPSESEDNEASMISRLAERANLRSGRESMKNARSGEGTNRSNQVVGPFRDGKRKTELFNQKANGKKQRHRNDEESSMEFGSDRSGHDQTDSVNGRHLQNSTRKHGFTSYPGTQEKKKETDRRDSSRSGQYDARYSQENEPINKSNRKKPGKPPLPGKQKTAVKGLDMDKVLGQQDLQNDNDDEGRDQYEDTNNIRHKIKNKGDVSDRIIGMGWNAAENCGDRFAPPTQDSPVKTNRASHLEYSTGGSQYFTQDGANGGEITQKDSTLQSLEQFNNKDLPGHLRCENLKQVLEYIQENKMQQYKNHKDNLECLFNLIIHSAELIGSQFEGLYQRIEEKEEEYAVEIQGYQETNMELEAELDLMEAELEKMKMYEQSYHTQEKKLKASLDRCDQTMTEKNNIETAHNDLLLDYNHLRNENDDYSMDNRRLKLEVEELNSRIEHLKRTILNQYERSQADQDKLDTSQTNDLPAFRSASFLVETYGMDSGQAQQDQSYGDNLFSIAKSAEKHDQHFNGSDNQNTTTVTEPPSASPFLSDDQAENESHLPLQDFKQEIYPSREQLALEQLIQQEEQSILKDVQTYHLNPELKKKIKNYIENNVQLNRDGLKLTIKKLSERMVHQDALFKKQTISLKFHNDSLQTDVKTARFIHDEVIQQNELKDQEILQLRENLQAVLNENQQLKDEKVRIMGVNSLLEQKIQVERSEMMSLQNDVDHFVRVGGPESMHSGANRKIGKMSSYLRKQQSIIRSIRGSTKSGLRIQRDNRPEQKIKNISEFDRVSFNDQNFMKYQTKKHLGNQSDYRGGGNSNNKQRKSSASLSGKDIVINDNSSDSGTVFHKNEQQSASGSHYSRPKSIGSKLRMVKRNERLSHKGSINSSLRGSVRSGSRRGSGLKPQHQQNRVQVISDFGSEQSIDNIEAGELVGINQEILAQEQQELINKRSTNNYDLIGLKDEKHPEYQKVHKVIQDYINDECMKADQAKRSAKKQKSWKKEIPKTFSLKESGSNSFYSENVMVYSQKQLQELIMVIKEGYVYLIQFEGPNRIPSLFCPPFDFLLDMSKLIYSEVHQNYIALKLNDVRSTNGARDHIVLQICDRELFADFLMAHAEENDDEVIFEQNEEFSMIINRSPVWFSFEDVERHKIMEHRKQFKSQDTTGFLEIRQNKAINYLKMMFQRNANWTQRYMSLQGMKLFMYQDQQYNKPIKIIELTEEMSIQEVRKVDIGGKPFVFSLTTPQPDTGTKSTEYLAAANEPKYKQWLKAFRAVKDQLVALKQIERDRLKQDVASAVVKNERASKVFLRGNQQYVPEKDLQAKVTKGMEILEEGINEEEEDKDDDQEDYLFFNAQEMVSPAIIEQTQQELLHIKSDLSSSMVVPEKSNDLSLTVVEEDPFDLSNN